MRFLVMINLRLKLFPISWIVLSIGISLWVSFNTPTKVKLTRWKNIYVAINLRNNEEIIPEMTSRLRGFFSLLEDDVGKFLSVFTNNNDDSTDELVELMMGEMVADLGIPSKIVVNGTSCGGFTRKPESMSRIEWLACVRNSAMQPLFNLSDSEELAVVFLNDVIFDPMDLVYLLETNSGDFEMSCGLDFYFNFYDLWVTRGIDGNFFSTYPPYAQDLLSASKLMAAVSPWGSNTDGIPVKCCWNGAVVINGENFLREGIRFRSEISPICGTQQSECKIFCEDILRNRKGNNWIEAIKLNPNVIVAYGKKLFYYNKLIRNFYFYLIFFMGKFLMFQFSVSGEGADNSALSMNCSVETSTSYLSAILVGIFWSGIVLFIFSNLLWRNRLWRRICMQLEP